MVGHKSISIDSLRRCFPNANKKRGLPCVWGQAALHFPKAMYSSFLTFVSILYCAAQPKCHRCQHLASFHCTLEAFSLSTIYNVAGVVTTLLI